MEYSFDYAMESNIGLVIFWLVYMLLMCGLGIAMYVLRSLGVYTIAKRRGIRHAWFAWVPVVDHYLLGCVSDQYQYVVKGREKNKRKVLLALNIILWLLYAIILVLYIALLVGVVRDAMGGMNEDQLVATVMGPTMGILGCFLPMLGVAIAVMVFRYMALYDLYTSCSPQNNVLFLVLSILFNVTEPFFIFFNRNKEDGMPPRKQQPPYIPAEPAYQPQPEPQYQPRTEVDPWEIRDN